MPGRWVYKTSDFQWERYLIDTDSEAAPRECFRQAEVPPTNDFQIGMKLVSLDNRNSSLRCRNWCIGSVVYTEGPRIKVRLDGVDELNDTWKMVDSDEIHPLSWAKDRNVIVPPLGFLPSLMKWPEFMAERLNSKDAAPAEAFKQPPMVTSMKKFAIGQKLESVDPHNPGIICVATVIGIVDSEKIRIEFDGWKSSHIVSANSRDIFPVGWCKAAGIQLQAPGPASFTNGVASKSSPNGKVKRTSLALIPEKHEVAEKKRKRSSVHGNVQSEETAASGPATPAGSTGDTGSSLLQINISTEEGQKRQSSSVDVVALKCEPKPSEISPAISGVASSNEAAEEIKVFVNTACNLGEYLLQRRMEKRKRRLGPISPANALRELIPVIMHGAKDASEMLRLLGQAMADLNCDASSSTGGVGTPTAASSLASTASIHTATEFWQATAAISRTLGCCRKVFSDVQLNQPCAECSSRLASAIKDNDDVAASTTTARNESTGGLLIPTPSSLLPQLSRSQLQSAAEFYEAASTTYGQPVDTAIAVATSTTFGLGATGLARTPPSRHPSGRPHGIIGENSTDARSPAVGTDLSPTPSSTTSTLLLQQPLVHSTTASPPSDWTVEEVYEFLSRIADQSISQHADLFRRNEIDGKALLLLSSDTIIKYLGLKLGPALKLSNLIERLRSRRSSGCVGGGSRNDLIVANTNNFVISKSRH